jgi:hypothetical protein
MEPAGLLAFIKNEVKSGISKQELRKIKVKIKFYEVSTMITKLSLSASVFCVIVSIVRPISLCFCSLVSLKSSVSCYSILAFISLHFCSFNFLSL